MTLGQQHPRVLFVAKVMLISGVTLAYFLIAHALTAISQHWLMQGLVLSGWTFGAVPGIYLLWRFDIRMEADNVR